MAMTNAEQYLLELINRARLDPAAEAARYGLGLNDGVPSANFIDTSAKQVLAYNSQLDSAATAHTVWMINTDTFNHVGVGGSYPWDRAETYGYRGFVGENIAFNQLGSGQTLASMIDVQHRGFMGSSLHREMMLRERFQEVGLGQEQGAFGNANGSMVTEVFGDRGSNNFLTGVAYTDRDNNGFYSMGEGTSGVALAIGQTGARTSTTGGYGFGVTPDSTALVNGLVGQLRFTVTVNLEPGNVKLDVVNGNLLLTSGNIILGTGIHNVRLLGVDGLDARGSSVANVITGNKGGNDLYGAGGNDRFFASAGNDRLFGDSGNDLMYGGDSNDQLYGGSGADSLSGDFGNDVLVGGSGNDALYGRAGADSFSFRAKFGTDAIRDFSLREGDKLILDDALWTGRLTEDAVVRTMSKVVNGQVVFDFGAGEVLRLVGVTTQSGLAAAIDII